MEKYSIVEIKDKSGSIYFEIQVLRQLKIPFFKMKEWWEPLAFYAYAFWVNRVYKIQMFNRHYLQKYQAEKELEIYKKSISLPVEKYKGYTAKPFLCYDNMDGINLIYLAEEYWNGKYDYGYRYYLSVESFKKEVDKLTAKTEILKREII